MTCLYFLEVTYRTDLSGTSECGKTTCILTDRRGGRRWILAFFNHYTERKKCQAIDRLILWLLCSSVSYHSYPSVSGKYLKKFALQKQNKLQKYRLKEKSDTIPYQRDVCVTLGSEALQDDSTPTAAAPDLSKLLHVKACSFKLSIISSISQHLLTQLTHSTPKETFVTKLTIPASHFQDESPFIWSISCHFCSSPSVILPFHFP